MSMTLKIIDSIKGFASKVNTELSKLLNNTIIAKKGKLTSDIKLFVQKQLLLQPEVKALTEDAGPNSLNAMIGISLAQGTAAVTEIINIISSSVRVDVRKFDKNLKGGVDLVFVDINIENLKSLPSGSLEILGGELNWIDWLLTKGDTPVIIGYRYSASTGGRTGGGIMKPGGTFRIPPEYSGTEDDNFITRAFVGESQSKEITNIVSRILS